MFICVLPNRIDIIPTRPKLSAPKHSLHFGVQPKNLFRSNTLDCSNNFFGRKHRNTLYQKMKIVTLFNLYTYFFESHRNIITKYISSIFDWTNKMIQKQALVMTFVDVFTHKHKYRNINTRRPRQSLGEFYRLNTFF